MQPIRKDRTLTAFALLCVLAWLALALTGCATYPPDLLVEQTQLLQKAADGNRAVVGNMKAEYVDAEIAKDDADRTSELHKEMAEKIAAVSSGTMTVAEFDEWTKTQYAAIAADEAQDDANRMAPLVQLETNASAIEGSIDRLKETAKKLNQ